MHAVHVVLYIYIHAYMQMAEVVLPMVHRYTVSRGTTPQMMTVSHSGRRGESVGFSCRYVLLEMEKYEVGADGVSPGVSLAGQTAARHA